MVTDTAPLPAQLRDLAQRVDRNVPSHTQPEQFHCEKSDIARRLETIADELAPQWGR